MPAVLQEGGIFVADLLTVLSLSTEEFMSSIRALGAKIAVFDCDGTLWSGDAGSSFMKWTIETGLVSREVTDAMDARYRKYLRGEVSEVAICGEMVQMYQGLREAEMRRAAREFFRSSIEPHIFPEMRSLIAELKAAGAGIWAVSSTNDWVIEEGVAQFGIPPEKVLAARVRVKDGLVTNEVIEIPTGEGKVEALARVGIGRPDAVFGNSVHDAAMLEIARAAYPVNPSPALIELSVPRGWAVYFPESVREPCK